VAINTLGGIFRRFLGSAVSNAAGYGVGGAILPTLEPYTRDLANITWSLHPEMPLPLNAAAEAELRGIMERGAAETEASYTGFDTSRYDVARRLRAQPPSLDALLALRRRDAITAGEFSDAIAQHGFLERWRGKFAALLPVLPSVTDMVRFAVREVYDPGQRAALDLDAEFPAAFAADAEQLGLSRETVGKYWAAHWELPSYEQLAQMLFRGELSAGEFSNALKAIDYAPTWRPKLEAIARAIPPISDMIRFAVRDVYSPATVAEFGLDEDFPAVFAEQAALHGMQPPYPQQYWQAHWRLPSALQGYRMLWRDEITPVQLDKLLKALDYPPFFRRRLANIAHLVPGRIDLKRMLRHEILDRDQVEAGYRRLGYAPVDAERMTAIAVAELEAGAVAQRWLERARTRLFTVAHDEFLDASLDAAQAGALVRQVGATAAEASAVVTLWQAERDVARLELTPAQIKRAFKAARFDQATAIAELGERGMTAEDADIYLTT
jgi:hypothetical protein